MKALPLCTFATLVWLCACGTNKPMQQEQESTAAVSTVPSPSGGIWEQPSWYALGAMLSQLGEPGIYDAPNESLNWSASQPHMLTLDLRGQVAELASASLWGGQSTIGLRALQLRFEELAGDPHLKSLLLRVDGLSIGMAAAQELRESMLVFRNGKRKLYCHTEGSSNVSYYLLSACDVIAMAPTGEVIISGVSAMPMHLKGLLDRLGVQADFLHVGDYKGAAEPLTLERPSKAMNETIAAILDQGYAALVEGISSGRGLPADTVRSMIDTAMFNSREAVTAKLTDHEATYEAFREQVAAKLPWKRIQLEDKKEPDFAELMEVVGLQARSRSSQDHVALVYAVGGIVDGGGEGLLGAREEIASRTLVAALRALAASDSVKAVVLRVDSGGGSALASELIWHAVEELKTKKPLVVSMGGVAASGGYYISAGADRIFADANTLTGSIGVVGGKLAVGGALEKLGVKSFPVGRGKRSMMWSTLGPWNQEERALVQKMMEDIYKVFVQRVADGRGKSYEEIHALAQGRVWTGSAALANGLIDELGGLDTALAYAAGLTGLDALGELEVYPPSPRLTDYLASYSLGVTAPQGVLLAQVQALLGTDAARVISETLHQLESFRQASIQTRLLLPVVWN